MTTASASAPIDTLQSCAELIPSGAMYSVDFEATFTNANGPTMSGTLSISDGTKIEHPETPAEARPFVDCVRALLK